MTYVTNTLTDSNAPATLYAALAAALTTEGFTLVDTNVISTRTHKIWKCPAASNPANLDWYLDIAYTTTGAGTLGLYPMEYFDPATDLAYRALCYSTNTSAPETTYYSRYGATGYTLENSLHGIYAGGTTANRDLTIPATTFGYWASVSPKRVVLFASNSPATAIYAGLYEPHADFAAQAAGSMFPLGGFKFNGGDAVYTAGEACLTRYPKDTTVGQLWYYRCWANGSVLLNAFGGFPLIPAGPTTLTTVHRAVRVPVYPYTAAGVYAAALYGYLYDVLAVMTTAVRGDTLTVGGQSYVFAGPYNNHALLMKAA